MWIYSEPGHGTTFKVYFPRVTDREVDAPIREETALGGTETVLIVEDDASLRALSARILEGSGYGAVHVGLHRRRGDAARRNRWRTAFLQKPFTPAQFATKVRDVLDQKDK